MSKAKTPRNKAQSDLWKNIRALMVHRNGKFTYDSLVLITGISKSTLQKSAVQGGATGLDIVEKIAKAFDLEVWQLLVPNFEPSDLPAYSTDKRNHLFEKIKEAYSELD